MRKLRILAVSLFSLALVVSSVSGLNVAKAVDAPTLVEAEAENTGGTAAKEAGDTVELEFSEATNEFAITEDNINDILSLNNSHSWLDGDGELGDVAWSSDGDELTITLSDDTSLPTVAVGDTITIEGDEIEDEDGNPFTGSVVIGGSFAIDDDADDDDEDCDEEEDNSSDDEDEDSDEQDEDTDDDDEDSDDDDEDSDDEDEDSDDEDEDEDSDEQDEDTNDEDADCEDDDNSGTMECNNALMNGKLYKIGSETTVYLAVKHCVLKPFRGAAVFHARGYKFQDVIALSALPAGVTISGEPVLPVEGTLVKGSDKTVWFIGHSGKRHGFVNAEVFTKLGFKFNQVETISDSDLNELPTDGTNVSTDTHHPDGSLIKCGNSAAVFVVIGGAQFPFTSAEVFQGRGHSFEHILNIDCGRFRYLQGPAVTE